MDNVQEINYLQISFDDCDTFCISSPRELSITRDVGERLVFAQMSEISYENVSEYYARLHLIDNVYPNSSVTWGLIFDDKGNEIDSRQLKVLDFITRIGITTNLKKDTLRNFLDRIVAHLDKLVERDLIKNSKTYDELLTIYDNCVDHFKMICDINDIGRVDATISIPGIIRAIDLAKTMADTKYLEDKNA